MRSIESVVRSRKFSGIFLAGSLVVGGSFLSACSTDEVPYAACGAVNPSGEHLDPTSYPTGDITVYYQQSVDIGNQQSTTQGVITETSGRYILDVKNIPNHLANDYTDFYGTDAAIIIDSPQTGEIGFTRGCMTRGEDSTGIPSTLVRLPSHSS